MFETCRDQLRGTGRPHGDEAEALAAEVLDTVDWDAYIERVDDSRPLYLMRAGRIDDSYGERADRLDWDALFCACPALFRSVAAHLARRFGHVLIDCRSGRSAATSVCTALMPDKMVGLFTPDPRSLDGLQGVVARALGRGGRGPGRGRGRRACARGGLRPGPPGTVVSRTTRQARRGGPQVPARDRARGRAARDGGGQARPGGEPARRRAGRRWLA